MAVIETTRPGAVGTGFGAGLLATLRSAMASFRSWNDTRATRAALNKLSDRELEDIGLCRGDIDTLSA